jgi:hypothetical protein
MADNPFASYAFLPWLRLGLAQRITRADGEPSPDVHVRIPVAVTLNADPNLTATAPLALFGPGEVTAINPGVIARVYPTPDTFDAESNYFPLIELEQPDLPWRYTPARATSADRLRPWLCLITLREDEIATFEETGADGRLPVVTIASGESLPKLDQSWAWAHVQVSGPQTQATNAAALQTLLATTPERVISRLISPRRLEPNLKYRAMLVPAFERGRLAGLREDVAGDALVPAWTPESSNLRLPVYFHWRFGTGAAGDFEFLARQLQPRQLPPGIGVRPLDASDAGLGLPPADTGPMTLEGALVPPRFKRAAWDGALPTAFRTKLAELLNTPAQLLAQPGGTRVVGPPLYGRWHARREELSLAANPTRPWFHTLNQDPRNRVPSGLGTLVIQNLQRQLMASAWLQVDGIREANQKLRFAQFARAAAERMFARHVNVSDDATVLNMTSPLHTKVRASPMTIAARIQTSPVAPGLLVPQFHRVTRGAGPLARRQRRRSDAPREPLLARMNRGDVKSAPPPAVPPGALTPKTGGEISGPGWLSDQDKARLAAWAKWLGALAVVLLIVAVITAAVVGFAVAAVALVAAVAAFVAREVVRRRLAAANRVTAFTEGTLQAADIEAATPPNHFRVTERALPSGDAPMTPAPGAATAARTDAEAVLLFRQASAEAMREISAPPIEPPVLQSVALSEVRNKLATELSPIKTFADSFRGRLRFPPGKVRQPPGDDPIEPVMAAPEFPQPMYKPLAELSQDWLLPGLDKIPPNTTVVLESNQTLIESYMVGLNHEMARELQWNEYPTDLQGTCFRQFWESQGYVGSADPATLRDIRALNEWHNSQLGANGLRNPDPAARQLVLLVRGELLRRYPNTIVYAVNAVIGTEGHELGDEELHPLFRGSLQPDVTFFGFDLTADKARGNPEPGAADQGWFFVFQEQPTEPRFGLDVAAAALGGAPTKWSDLSWSHLAATEAEFSAIRYIDLDAQLPDTSQVTEAGSAAWHADAGLGAHGAAAAHLAFITLQQPMRVALHGADMIVPA